MYEAIEHYKVYKQKQSKVNPNQLKLALWETIV
jgi:hypothetical protein